MATDYTQGIINGKINTFKEFALVCARAFGSMTHMRGAELSAEYKERLPDSYLDVRIEEINEEIKELNLLSNEDILKREKEKIKKGIERHKNEVLNKTELKIKLNKFLFDARSYKPPTEDHVGVKNFIIEQLEKCIEDECDFDYNNKEIYRLNKKLNNLKPDTIKLNYLSEFYGLLEFHYKEKNKDLEACKNANNWYEIYLKSLENE